MAEQLRPRWGQPVSALSIHVFFLVAWPPGISSVIPGGRRGSLTFVMYLP